ncbi:MAG: hypothetical protein FJW32_26455 [Acidobacteria bacterium]|nr:hypothetical protein [Acidobacteriota bacterium]
MDLSRWSRDYYNPSTLTRWMLAIGAAPIRCEYCRNNFWSFRFIREKFSREKRAARSHVAVPVRPDPDDETDSALASGQQRVVR